MDEIFKFKYNIEKTFKELSISIDGDFAYCFPSSFRGIKNKLYPI